MRMGSLLALVALLLLGGAGGYAAAQGLRSEPDQLGTPHPLAADEAPEMPAADPLPDSTIPALDPGLELTDSVVDNGEKKARVPVPAGWDPTDITGIGTIWALPEHPDGAYSVRVKRLDSALAPYAAVLRRAQSLPNDPTITELTIVSETARASGTIAFTFVKDGYRKLSIVRFASFPGSDKADVEIAWTGRLVDEPGMRGLIAQMSAGVRPAR